VPRSKLLWWYSGRPQPKVSEKKPVGGAGDGTRQSSVPGRWSRSWSVESSRFAPSGARKEGGRHLIRGPEAPRSWGTREQKREENSSWRQRRPMECSADPRARRRAAIRGGPADIARRGWLGPGAARMAYGRPVGMCEQGSKGRSLGQVERSPPGQRRLSYRPPTAASNPSWFRTSGRFPRARQKTETRKDAAVLPLAGILWILPILSTAKCSNGGANLKMIDQSLTRAALGARDHERCGLRRRPGYGEGRHQGVLPQHRAGWNDPQTWARAPPTTSARRSSSPHTSGGGGEGQPPCRQDQLPPVSHDGWLFMPQTGYIKTSSPRSSADPTLALRRRPSPLRSRSRAREPIYEMLFLPLRWTFGRQGRKPLPGDPSGPSGS